MKKLLSIFIALTVFVSTMAIGTTASASNEISATTDLIEHVYEQKLSAGERVYNETQTSFTVDNAGDYVALLMSGVTGKEDNDAFVSDVMDNLSANDGKIVPSFGENAGTYGAVVKALQILGYDASSFSSEKYDIMAAFDVVDISADINPYYYRYAIETANKDLALSLCDKLINDYYSLGSGMNYWGYSCDNTAVFLSSIAKYKDNYKKYVEDAKTIIQSHTTSKGAFYNSQYTTDTNADSTASALLAYSAIGDATTAFKYYKALVECFEGSVGEFGYMDTTYNSYATKDALLALNYFYITILDCEYEHRQEVVKTTVVKATPTANGKITKTCVICGKSTPTTILKPSSIALSKTAYVYDGNAKKPTVTVKNSGGTKISSSNYTVTYSNNTKVGTATVKIKFKGNYSGTVTRTFKINPKGTSISKLTATSKGFKAAWKKQATQTTGYQIRYSTSSSMANAVTKTISKNNTVSKTVSKLKAKKKYYVQIRTYKTVNGKKYYSSWSAKKYVTTKE